MKSSFSFKCKDAEGQVHEYTGSVLPFRQGRPILGEILFVLGPVVALQATGKMTAEGLRQAIQNGIVTLLDEDMITKLLGSVMRDGNLLVPEVMDVAYAGNYEEMLEALGEVIKANGFLSRLKSKISVGGMLNAAETGLTAMLETPSPESETGERPRNEG